MNKAKLVDQMAKIARMPKSACRGAVDAFILVVSTALKENQNVVLTGFGTFKVIQRKSRTGVNPATGKKMTIVAKKVPRFSAGKALKELIEV
jgi:DNA-binding protein HU-beta